MISCGFSASSPLYFEKSTGGTITGFPGRGVVRDGRTVADRPRQHHNSQSIIGQVDSHPDPFVSSGNSGNAVRVGGNWSNGDNAGLSYLNNGNVGGNSNNGSRLNRTLNSYFTVIPTSPLGETVQTIQIWLVPWAFGRIGTARCGLKAATVIA